MAAVIEFIHTATLLHDDVVDMSLLRRGRPTVNSQWDNASSVLVGDFIYSRAFQILVDIGDLRVMEIIANTTNKIAEGEVLQLIAKNNPNSSEQNYLQVIKNKTAILFQAAAQCGAILGQADITTEKSLQHYGMHIGIAFQLIDDVLDYDGDTQTMGKNIGDDLAEGKPTLPLIYAMEKGDNDQSRKIKEVLQQKNVSEKVLHEVIQIVRESGALDYTRKLARQQAAAAMDSLKSIEKSAFREALISMAKFSLRRSN
jgi:octaprenyl-diphosphate synthase